jgi:hypothetical protein
MPMDSPEKRFFERRLQFAERIRAALVGCGLLEGIDFSIVEGEEPLPRIRIELRDRSKITLEFLLAIHRPGYEEFRHGKNFSEYPWLIGEWVWGVKVVTLDSTAQHGKLVLESNGSQFSIVTLPADWKEIGELINQAVKARDDI